MSTVLAAISSPFAAFQMEKAVSEDIAFAGLPIELAFGIRAGSLLLRHA